MSKVGRIETCPISDTQASAEYWVSAQLGEPFRSGINPMNALTLIFAGWLSRLQLGRDPRGLLVAVPMTTDNAQGRGDRTHCSERENHETEAANDILPFQRIDR